ncbi:MAG TPA: LysE family translocator [Micromonosporaceae bacterium]
MVRPILFAVLALGLLTVVPGPDMAVVTGSAVAGGRRAAARTATGVVTGLLLWGLLSVAGLAAVLVASAKAYSVVRIAGAVYLVLFGVRSWWGTRRSQTPPVVPPGEAKVAGWRAGLLTNLLNPKIAVFYTSLLPQLVPPAAPRTATMAGLVLTHAALSLLWLYGYAVLLNRFRPVLNRPRVRRWLQRATGTVMIGFGLRVALASR